MTLNLTISEVATATDTKSACGSYTWIDGITYTESNTTATDTLTAANGCDSIVTLNLTISDSTTGTDVIVSETPIVWIDGITYSESNTTATFTLTNAAGCDSVVTLHLTINAPTAPVEVPAGALEGLFSVSSTQQVRFSQGNLQYTTVGTHLCADRTTQAGTWRFAENQYDIIGEANAQAAATYAGFTDLFGWGTSGWNSGAVAYYPYSTSTTSTDYHVGGSYTNSLTDSCAFADWGIYNAISNGGNVPMRWRTLTSDEWRYLFSDRSASTVCGTADARYCMVQVDSVNGVVLFPDSYVHPAAAPALQYINQNGFGATFAANAISSTAWEAMEAAGAVFLPAAGSRNGTEVANLGENGYYWSSTYRDNSNAYLHYFYPAVVYPVNVNSRYVGFSVRLVQNSEDPCEGATTTGIDERTACNSLRWIDGNIYTESTDSVTYIIRNGNAAWCDSIVTLHLTVSNDNPPTYGTDEQTACDSYRWIDGNTYYGDTAATYTIVGGNAVGCDSIVTLHLTLRHSVTSSITREACSRFVLDGVAFTESGDYLRRYRSAEGCDSIMELLLTIQPYSIGARYEASADEQYTWAASGEQGRGADTIYTASGTYVGPEYTTEEGCHAHDTLVLSLTHIQHDTVTLSDTIIVENNIYDTITLSDTIIVENNIYDTVTLSDTVLVDNNIYDTVTLSDTIMVDNYIYDTVTLSDTVIVENNIYDTITLSDTVIVENNIYDTITLSDTVIVENNIYDTVYQVVTNTIYDTVTQTVTNTVHDTVTITNVIHDIRTEYVHDTLTLHVTDTVVRISPIYLNDTVYQVVERIFTVFDTILDTAFIVNTVHDTVTLTQIETLINTVHDTVYRTNTVHDTIVVTNTITETLINTVHDTVTNTVYRTNTVHDTVTTVVFRTNTVFDTIYRINNIFDTVVQTRTRTVHDTVYRTNTVHDTVTDIVYRTNTVHDTVHHTNYVHDTVYRTRTVRDTVTYLIYDTIPEYHTEYEFIYDTAYRTIYNIDTLWLYDTVYRTREHHDTIYVHDTIYMELNGIVGAMPVDAKIYVADRQVVVEGSEGQPVVLYDLQGRVLATRRDTYLPIRFDVPASGVYMVKIADYAAKKVTVVR